MVSWLSMSSSSSPFTYKAVEVIFGRIYFYFHLQTDHWLQPLQVTIFHENVGFGNMRIITLISIVSWLPISSSSSPFTYKAVEVIFRRIYFYFHLQTAPNLQDCSHSHNLPTFPESTLPGAKHDKEAENVKMSGLVARQQAAGRSTTYLGCWLWNVASCKCQLR